MASTYARLDDAEAAGRMNGDWTKAGFIQQVTVLLFGALKTTGPAQHVQIAHGNRNVWFSQERLPRQRSKTVC